MAESNGEIRNNDGTFGKGNPGKPRGAVTKISVKVRESIVNFLESNVDKIQSDFDKLKPGERLKFVAEILPYAAPKLSSVQIDQETNISGGITIKWEEPRIQDSLHQSSNGELQGLQSGIPDNS